MFIYNHSKLENFKGFNGISDIFILLLVFFFQKLAQHILNIHCTRISLLNIQKNPCATTI